ncbi:hypothetical protein D9M68_926380 [compost metagenome]
MTSSNFSLLPSARPPETMILAAVRSGRSFLAISLPTNVLLPASAAAAAVSTAAEPPVAAAASKPVVRTVMTFTLSLLCTVAIALPA